SWRLQSGELGQLLDPVAQRGGATLGDAALDARAIGVDDASLIGRSRAGPSFASARHGLVIAPGSAAPEVGTGVADVDRPHAVLGRVQALDADAEPELLDIGQQRFAEHRRDALACDAVELEAQRTVARQILVVDDLLGDDIARRAAPEAGKLGPLAVDTDLELPGLDRTRPHASITRCAAIGVGVARRAVAARLRRDGLYALERVADHGARH